MTRTRPASLARILGVLALAAVLPACGSKDSKNAAATLTFDLALAQNVMLHHADLMFAMYSDGVVVAQALQTAVNALTGTATPTSGQHTACKTAWLAARPFYIQSEAGRFADGPIDSTLLDNREVFINAWPLDETFIENAGAPLGILDDTVLFPTLDETTIRGLNESGGETHISCGWHAIEFLLWGTDTDLTTGVGGVRTEAAFTGAGGLPLRRRQYLKTVTDMLVADLILVRDQWAPATPGNYRADFLALPIGTAIGRLMTGLGTLAFGELRNQRINEPFQTKLDNEEHSCFSDTTHLDHRNDAQSLKNVWLGSYTSSNGANNVASLGFGLKDLAQTASAAQTALVDAAIDANVNILDFTLHAALFPFEVAYAQTVGTPPDAGAVALQAALNTLADFNLKYSALAAAMGLSITTN